MLRLVINNSFIPLRLSMIRNVHIALFCIVFVVMTVQLLFVSVPVSMSSLYRTAFYKMDKLGFDVNNLSEEKFNVRGNNLWENLLYYKKYSTQLKKYFNVSRPQMPLPRFPLISVLFSLFYDGVQIFPPTNLVDIAEFLRIKVGAGITIRSKNKLLGSYSFSGMKNKQFVDFFSDLKKSLENRFEIHLKYLNRYNKIINKKYFVSYGNFPNFTEILFKLIDSRVKFLSVSLHKNYRVESILYPSQKYLDSRVIDHSKIVSNNLEDIFSILNVFKQHMAFIYTFNVVLKVNGQNVYKKFLVRFDNYPRLYFILSNLQGKGVEFKKLSISESKILKYKPNSREWIDSSDIPSVIRKAFILLEDDYFYFQAGGIDPIGLIKATYRYIFYGEHKGNASIIEQIYEMYLGKQNKGPFDKLIQVFGAIYLSSYEFDRDRFANLYVQSVPGSFWRDHNYGIKGIIKSYLNKDSIKDITLRELAWLSRIALLPNTFGIDYIRYYIINKRLKEYNVDVSDNSSLNSFLNHSDYARDILASLYFKFNDNIKAISQYIRKLYRSYIVTNRYIAMALKQFVTGNEFLKPIITRKEYDSAISSSISFSPSKFVNIYQSYTDQTRKDLLRFVGSWGMNAGLDVEVAFDERVQKILDEELNKSTKNMYSYISQENVIDEEYKKRYGGAGVLVKTHKIKNNAILNRIIAISSKHTGNSFFNWAVDGNRQFGSILKWILLMLYLDSKGTLLDSFYDIPRVFKYKKTASDGKLKTFEYRPDNWKRRGDPYGFYTFDLRDNVYNFIQSKNNTFVYLSEIVGLKRFADFLNETAEIKYIKDENKRSRLSSKPILPLVLGAQESTIVRMAQINTIIANKGIFQPLTTIVKIIDMDGKSSYLDLSSERKQIVSREAAEAAFLCGYLNSYFGTAKRFIRGGVGKTGSSNMDIGFLAMSARTKNEYLPENSNHLLNSNLLYLVNMGLDRGAVHTGLFGGTVGAINSKNVFKRLLREKVNGRIVNHSISGKFTDFFSDKFEYVDYNFYPKIKGEKIRIPIMRNKDITSEAKISDEDIAFIKVDYVEYRDSIRVENLAREIAHTNDLIYDKLSLLDKERLKEEAFAQIQSLDFMGPDGYLSNYDLNNTSDSDDVNLNKDDNILDDGGIFSKLENLASKKNSYDNKKNQYVFSSPNKKLSSSDGSGDEDILNQIFKSERDKIKNDGMKFSKDNLNKNSTFDAGDGFAPILNDR